MESTGCLESVENTGCLESMEGSSRSSRNGSDLHTLVCFSLPLWIVWVLLLLELASPYASFLCLYDECYQFLIVGVDFKIPVSFSF